MNGLLEIPRVSAPVPKVTTTTLPTINASPVTSASTLESQLTEVPKISSPYLSSVSDPKISSTSLNITKSKLPSLPDGLAGITANVKNVGINPLVGQLGSIGKGGLPSILSANSIKT